MNRKTPLAATTASNYRGTKKTANGGVNLI